MLDEVETLGGGDVDRAQLRFSAILLTLTLALPVNAYEYPVSPQAIRQAYFFGRSTERAKVLNFLGQYVRRFEPRNGGPGVGRIELRTPYERIVLRSWDNQPGYSAQQAQLDYSGLGQTVEVQIFLYLGDDAAHPRPSDLYSDSEGQARNRRENFWREFRFRVMQGRVVQPKETLGQPLYGRRGQGLAGAEVRLVFDAREFADLELQVGVTSPDGRVTVADFPLDQLK